VDMEVDAAGAGAAQPVQVETPATIYADLTVVKICSFTEGFSMEAIHLSRSIAPLLAVPASSVIAIPCVVVQACMPMHVVFAE